MSEPSIRQAALLTMYWQQGDYEAVVLLLADLRTEGGCRCQDLEDVITALLIMRDKPMAQVELVARSLPPVTA